MPGSSGRLLVNEPDQAIVGSPQTGNILLRATSATNNTLFLDQNIEVVSGLAELTIVPATEAEVELTADFALSASASYTAETSLQDETVTDLVQWSVSDELIATVSNAADSEGVITGVSVGDTIVTARCGEQTQTVAVSVINPTVFSQLLISPDDDPLELTLNGSTQQLTITAVSASGARIDVTDLAVYQVTRGDNVISVDSAGTTRGEVIPRAEGTAVINVEFRGVENNLNVRVR